MIKTLTIILLLFACQSYGQTWQWPNLDLYSKPGQVQIRNNIMYAVQRSVDSLAKIIRAEAVVVNAANAKALKDSMATILYSDTNYLPVRNGKVIVNFKKPYDSSGVVAKNLNTVNTTLTNNINIVSARVTINENSIASLNTNYSTLNGRVIILENKVGTINTDIATLQEQIKNIPKKAITITTSTSTTTLSP